ncbi:MAG TPA: hypothetical protein VMB19_14985 [Silvibacterium sp.]|nr:hypothetical protein [Silvibacterium sp.]
MRIRRTLPIALAVVIVAAAVTVAVQLRKHAPPEPARLLPSADGFLYANFGWIRKITSTPLPAVSHDPDYERFIAETGFDFERDLDAVAFAVHYPASWPGGGTGGPAPEPRFSEVFVGKFNGERLAGYLRHTARSIENYNSVEIFTIAVQDRLFRVAILNVEMVAASNHDDPAVIRGIVDRSRRLASPFGGPALLRRYYKQVQLASPFWSIARIEPSAPGFVGWSEVFPNPADIVISASYNPLHFPLRTGALHVRAEAWAANSTDALTIADKMGALLAMFRSAESSVGSPANDADLKVFLDSLQVREEDSRAVLYATVPAGIFRKLLESPAQLPTPEIPLASPPPASKKH